MVVPETAQFTQPTPAFEKKVAPNASVSSSETPLINTFLRNHKELQGYRQGLPVVIDGQTLSIAAITAASRYGANIVLDESEEIKERVAASRHIMATKVGNNTSVYGVTTGFGGSADTRTDKPLILCHALLQHQHSGVLPSEIKNLDALPLTDPLGMSMPESWVRGAMVVRLNSLIRGHSAVRWELIESLGKIVSSNITPFVPLRGSISASGDLSPLSYVAGTMTGNPSIRVYDGEFVEGRRKIVSSLEALKTHGIEPLSLVEKEPLGILNGTAFSASVAALALNDAVHLTLLAHVLTAMGVEALVGTRCSFDPFIHNTCRPHPGQVESAKLLFDLLEDSKLATLHEQEVSLDEDKGTLRQDRYALRTSPQFIGPQIEDLLASLAVITQESNSTTDNPLVDGATGEIHHGGNFQAMAVSNAMEKTRLSLHHIGKLLYSQCTELVNPALNRGLPPSLAATDPSLNYHAKGVDIATSAYVSELGFLANPVTTHIQSAEMHNQAINSLALISARATITALEVLSMLSASYLYALCQALDLRALQSEFLQGLDAIVAEELAFAFGASVGRSSQLVEDVTFVTHTIFEQTSTMDAGDRMEKIAASTSATLVDHLSALDPSTLAEIPAFRSRVASKATELLQKLRDEYLTGARGAAPASPFLGKTKPVYEFVRLTLGVKMHGTENHIRFARGGGFEEPTIGQNVSLIHEAIRDGKLQDIVVGLL